MLTIGAGFVFAITPFIIYDLKNGHFLQTIGFFGWLILKPLESLNSVFNSGHLITGSLSGAYLLKDIIFPPSFTASLLLVLSGVWLSFKDKRSSSELKILAAVWLFFTLISFVIRGSFSEAYMPLIYFPLVYFTSHSIYFLLRKLKLLGVMLLGLIITVNIYAVYGSYQKQLDSGLNYQDKLLTSSYIIKQAKGSKFRLEYLGSGYQFHSGDAHYRYLLWWLGSEPQVKADLTYGVFEHPFEIPDNFMEINRIGKIRVGVKK